MYPHDMQVHVRFPPARLPLVCCALNGPTASLVLRRLKIVPGSLYNGGIILRLAHPPFRSRSYFWAYPSRVHGWACWAGSLQSKRPGASGIMVQGLMARHSEQFELMRRRAWRTCLGFRLERLNYGGMCSSTTPSFKLFDRTPKKWHSRIHTARLRHAKFDLDFAPS